MNAPDSFRAPWPLSLGHLQTLGAALPLHARPPPGAVDAPLRIAIDGGQLHAQGWWHAGRRPTALLVHGVGGSVASQYVVRAAKAFHAAGYHAVRLDMRGAGGSIVDAPSLYHAGLAEDLGVAAAFLKARPEVENVVLVGFSLGGNCALRFAALPQASSLVRAVIAVSAPMDLANVSRLINRPVSYFYKQFILRSLIQQARDFARLHPARATYDLARLGGIRTIWDYDDLVVAPMHGFGTAARYYAAVSAGPALPGIEVPTLLVHADDDPMVPGHTVRPFLDARAPVVELAWSARGGHVGWFSGFGEAAWLRTWALEQALEFLGRR